MIKEIEMRIQVSEERLEAFCRKWAVARLEIFGSVLRQDFDPKRSDVDVMVTLAPERRYTLLDFIEMEDELSAMFGRKAELTERSTVENSANYIRRRHILGEAQVLYER